MSLASIVDFVLLAAIWGSSFLFMRLAIGEFGVMGTAAVRVAVASAVLIPIVAWRGLGPELRKHWKTIALIGLINSGIPFALFAFSLLSITTGLSAILNATAPLFGALVAWFWLSDRLTGSRVLGLAIGFAGVALLAWDKASFRADASGVAPGWAVVACLAATLLYGIAANAAKRYLTGLSPLVTAAGSQIGATIGLAIPALFVMPQQMPGAQAWAAVLVAGVLCTAVAYILYFRLIEQAGPARAVAVTFLVPVFAVIYGTLFLDEQVTPWMVLCGLVIVCGTALSTGLVKLPAFRPQRPAQRPTE
jgi:drug/metabolite transporter (DMT)-like permease